jgi:ubiquinone/menaquinone biosynthesis C-methylase UbiE
MTHSASVSIDTVFNTLATEYYDSRLHPTCNNFRVASMRIVRCHIGNRRGRFCEVGSGKSVLAELLSENATQLPEVLLTDSSAAMLEHSRGWERLGAKLEIASANHLSVEDSSIGTLVASLGDPYNDETFWREASRVLSPNGTIVFTTPSYEWSASFRRDLPENLMTKAEFVLSSGQQVWIPSIIHPEQEQIRMIEGAGLSVVKVEPITLGDLAGERLSPKLMVLGEPSAPVVTGYLARR